ncbi:hypothetical protein FBEOM_8855 [Fusarium beomiforme]|uniref:Transcription factor domain-containing protein n=1 Tax=Fusarium beomiforme TaxID=44412 RepID=A0A9P5AEF3_9HYPO|nr:hypothetical protein FBEOM_8855 [Fusarium beomiforme]
MESAITTSPLKPSGESDPSPRRATTDWMPAIVAEHINDSFQWLPCDSLTPLLPFGFDVLHDIYISPSLNQKTSSEKISLPFLKRFTESSSIVDGFDCGTLDQRRKLNEPLDDPQDQALIVKTSEIVSLIRRTTTRTQQRLDCNMSWSPVMEKACLDFFSPGNLCRYLRLFWSGWYPNSPIIHKPSFNLEAEPAGLVASLAVLGACLSPEPDDCVRAMAWLTPVEDAVFNDKVLFDSSIIASSDLAGDEPVMWNKLKALHAAYFICIAQNWEGSKEGRQRVRMDRYSHIVSVCNIALAYRSPADVI